jgi:U3 small nucleolar RNA-associated protein 13
MNTVLDVNFMSLGMQLATAGADGLVKVWNIRDSECIATLDNHTDRVWTLAVSKAESHLVSGSSDSSITVWRDITSETKHKTEEEDKTALVKSHDLDLFVARGDYTNALILAMQLDMPHQTLTILNTVFVSSTASIESVETYISSLDDTTLERLLGYVRDWNTHSRHSYIAQRILEIILKRFPAKRLIELNGAKELIDALGAYTSRHFEHANEMMKVCCVVGYTLECMDLV